MSKWVIIWNGVGTWELLHLVIICPHYAKPIWNNDHIWKKNHAKQARGYYVWYWIDVVNRANILVRIWEKRVRLILDAIHAYFLYFLFFIRYIRFENLLGVYILQSQIFHTIYTIYRSKNKYLYENSHEIQTHSFNFWRLSIACNFRNNCW